jgi:hypothetical protein
MSRCALDIMWNIVSSRYAVRVTSVVHNGRSEHPGAVVSIAESPIDSAKVFKPNSPLYI